MSRKFKYLSSKSKYILVILTIICFILGGISIYELGGISIYEAKTKNVKTNIPDLSYQEISENQLSIIQGNSLLPTLDPVCPTRIVKEMKVIVTGYSSSVYETDDDPNITASGSLVREGVVANNYLPFGTKIRIPELYGDKVFVVEDRMHWKKGYYHVDIWFPSYWQAKTFGATRTDIEILEG